MTAPGVMCDVPPGCEPGEEWISLAPWGFSKYEIRSRGGYGLDENQWPVRRIDNRRPLKVSLGSNGYPRVKPYSDGGQQKTVEVHALVMLANAGPPDLGQETRHLDNDPLNYRWAPGGEDAAKLAGGNLVYGTRKANHADQVAAGTATKPEHPCLLRCGREPASFKGARCRLCTMEAGVEAARLLDEGVPLAEVTRRCDYTSESWTFAVAREFGGYRATIEEARRGPAVQVRPVGGSLLRRVTGWFRRTGGR